MLKLLTIEKLLGKNIRKIIVTTDKDSFNKKFGAKSWAGKAFSLFKFEYVFIELDADNVRLLESTRKLQSR